MNHRSTPPVEVPAPAPSSAALAISLIIAMVLITATLVGFVRLKSAQVEAGYRIHDQRSRLVVLEQQRSALDVERAALARPSRLAQIARTTLGLVPADTASAATTTSIAVPSSPAGAP